MIDSTDSDKEKTGKITRSRILDAFKGIGMLMIVSIHVLQWSNLFPQPGVMNNIRTSGLLGVEITFIINAFLLARSYDSRVRGGTDTSWQLIGKSFMRIIPLYWLLMTLYIIGEVVKNGIIVETWWDIVLHYLFLNWLTPSLFFSCVGGSGYIAVLSLMWMLYPIMLRRIKTLGSSIVIGVICVSIGFLLYRILFLLNGIIYEIPGSIWEPWLWYIYRGIYSYGLGSILYYVVKEGAFNKLSDCQKIVCSIMCALVMVERALEVGSLQNGLIFAMLCTMLIALNINRRATGLKILPVIGRYSMEIFAAHIISYYLLVDTLGLLHSVKERFIGMLLMTVVLIIPLNKIGILISKFLNSFSNRMIGRTKYIIRWCHK